MTSKTIFFLLIFLILVQSAVSQLRLPAVISDNMVLQRNAEARIWGWDNPGVQVNVRAGWTLDEFKAQADANGEWSVILPTTIAGGPYNIYIKGSNEIVVSNILLGDVWICSGQSNMEYKINWMGGWGNPWFEMDSIDIEKTNIR